MHLPELRKKDILNKKYNFQKTAVVILQLEPHLLSPRRKGQNSIVIYYDPVCGLCLGLWCSEFPLEGVVEPPHVLAAFTPVANRLADLLSCQHLFSLLFSCFTTYSRLIVKSITDNKTIKYLIDSGHRRIQFNGFICLNKSLKFLVKKWPYCKNNKIIKY